MKKILILYTSTGGHRVVAENIGFHLQQAGYEVRLYDVLRLQAGFLVKITAPLQSFILNRMPFIWQWLYTHANRGWFARMTLPNRVKVASKNYQHVKKVVDEFQPDLVITTQTSASAIVQYLKEQGFYKGLFAIGFSDYHLHRYWLYDGADFYLPNTEQQKQQMIKLGIPAEKIFVIGVTLQPYQQVDALAIKQRLGIKAKERVVLVASGSLGSGLSAGWLTKLAQVVIKIPQTKLIIVCGYNQNLETKLKKLIPNDQVLVYGYYSPLTELLSISDICIAKPGGMTVAEALQEHLPLLISHYLPGHEQLNYNYLVNNGLVMAKPKGVEPISFLPILEHELDSHAFRQSLISNPTAVQLIQVQQEGQALLAAVKTGFHEV